MIVLHPLKEEVVMAELEPTGPSTMTVFDREFQPMELFDASGQKLGISTRIIGFRP